MSKKIPMNNSKTIHRISPLFAVILCVFITDSMALPVSESFKVYLIAFYGLYALFKVIFNYNYFKLGDVLPIFAVLISFTLFVQILYGDKSLSYEYRVSQFIIGLYIVRSLSLKAFAIKYISLIKFIALFSLIVWGLLHINISSIVNLFPLSGGGDYHTLFFYVVPINSSLLNRNFGPFWEPGVFQMYLNIALLFLLFLDNKKGKGRLIFLFIICILTTFSTTGYLCTMLIVLSYFYENSTKVKWYQFLAFILALLLIWYGINALGFFDIIFGKFSSVSSKAASYAIRLNDLEYYYEVWKNHFIIGAGFTNAYNYVINQHSISDFVFEGSSNTTLRELASYGLIIGIISLIGYYKFVSQLVNKKTTRVLLMGVLILLINSQCMLLSLFFNTIIMFGLNYSKNNLNEKSNASVWNTA
jgi:hypothetical protein